MIFRTSRRGARAVLAAGCVAAVAAGTAVVATPAAAEDRTTLVVVLHDTESPGAVGREMARRHGGQLGLVYEHALKGFSITVPEHTGQAISRDRRVRSVERDQVFSTTQTSEVPTGVARTFAPANGNLDIDRTDDFRVDVDIAIIDTGIAPHADLNIAASTNCSGGSPMKKSCTDGSPQDGNGHGTHVAGSAAALDNGSGVVGMAPGARLHGVKVLSDSGSGYTSWIIAGIDWVTAHNTDADTSNDIEVANMSLGCECSSAAQDEAITRSVAAGVTYAVAAGNSNKDASTFSPANHPQVIAVSALADFDGTRGGVIGAATSPPYCRADVDDTLADFSNWGATVDIAAPGVCISSTWPGGGFNTISGTSMASPHVAGAAAVLAATPSTDPWTPASILAALQAENDVTDGWIDDGGTAEHPDPHREALLNVADSTVFAPAMVAAQPASTTITLTASAPRTAKNGTFVDLAWTGASSVDVLRNGSRIASVTGTSYTDKLRSSGTYKYLVCHAGTTTCSNEVTVTF